MGKIYVKIPGLECAEIDGEKVNLNGHTIHGHWPSLRKELMETVGWVETLSFDGMKIESKCGCFTKKSGGGMNGWGSSRNVLCEEHSPT